MAILALENELLSGTGIVAMLHDELVIETDGVDCRGNVASCEAKDGGIGRIGI
jgi:hypothetical protein